MAWWSSLGGLWGGGGATSGMGAGGGTPVSLDVGYTPVGDAGAPMGESSGGMVLGGGDAMQPQAAPAGGGWSKQALGALQVGANSADKIGQAVTKPTAEKRARLIPMIGASNHVGSGIQPVALTRGGAAMAGAAAYERGNANDATSDYALAALERRLRNVKALGETVQNGVGLVKDLAVNYYTGGMGGGGGGGGGGLGSLMGGMGGGG